MCCSCEIYCVILDTTSTSAGTVNGKQLDVIFVLLVLFLQTEGRLLHQRIHVEGLSREEGVKLINTNVIKFLRRIARSLEMQRYCLTSFNCNHKEAIVIKVLMNATQKLLMTLHFFATHWQPVFILISIPVKVVYSHNDL